MRKIAVDRDSYHIAWDHASKVDTRKYSVLPEVKAVLDKALWTPADLAREVAGLAKRAEEENLYNKWGIDSDVKTSPRTVNRVITGQVSPFHEDSQPKSITKLVAQALIRDVETLFGKPPMIEDSYNLELACE